MNSDVVRVGVCVIIRDNKGRVLLGRRKSQLGRGTWGPPGGKMEIGEDIQECAERETKEETGMKIGHMRFLCVTNDIFNRSTHFVTIFVDAITLSGSPLVMEPEKLEEWRYFDEANLPQPLFLPYRNFVDGKCDTYLRV